MSGAIRQDRAPRGVPPRRRHGQVLARV